MSLLFTIIPGAVFEDGVPVDIALLNAAARPTIVSEGGVGSGDLADFCVTAAKLNPNAINGMTAVTALAGDDKFAIYDASGAGNGCITVAAALNGILGLAPAVTAFTSYAADLVPGYGNSLAQAMTVARFAQQLLAQAPALTATDDADEVLVRDTSAADGSQASRATLANLLPDKGTAGTYANPTSIQTDAKGRVVAVATNGQGRMTVTADGSLVALPTGIGSASAVNIPHGLGARPRFVWVTLVCTDAGGDAGYAQNEEVEKDQFTFSEPTSELGVHYCVRWNATNVVVMEPDNGGVLCPHGSTGASTTPTKTKWKLRAVAIL